MKHKVKVWLALAALSCLVAAFRPAAAAAEGAPEYELSLAQALRTALDHNLDLVSARMDPEIAEQEIEQDLAPFDGAIEFNPSYRDRSSDSSFTNTASITDTSGTTTVVVSGDGTDDSEIIAGNLSFSHLQEFGGLYSLTVSASDSDVASFGVNPSTGELTEFSDATTGEDVRFHFETPLMRGLGKEANTIEVLLSRSGRERSLEDLQFEATRVMKEVEDAYWDLLASHAALRVARESLNLAQDLYELNKKKVEVGTLAPIDVTQAEAGVAGREEDVIVAETAVENAEDALRRLLGIPHDDPLWHQRILPTDRPTFEERTVDLEAALLTALDRRPEIRNARRALQDAELSERVARNGVKHDLTVSADVTWDQDDGDQTIARLGLITQRSNEISDGDGTDWSVALTYRYPLRNRRAKANYAIAKLNRRKSDVALTNVEQDIRVDVRVAARNVESGIKRVEAAQANTTLQRKTLEAEQKKYENGMSTSFEVLRIQNDLSDAQFAEIQAMLDYTKSLADLERARGTLLEARGLALD